MSRLCQAYQVFLIAASLLVVGCRAPSPHPQPLNPDVAPAPVYNRFNIHYYVKKGPLGKKNIAGFRNFVRSANHALIPFNSELDIGPHWKGFTLTDISTGKSIIFEYDADEMEGVSADDYLQLITSPNPVSYEDISPLDRRGIEEGKALPGMSREGVKIALGYPAKNKTPSLEMNKWTYWQTRSSVLIVEFDDNDTVISIID